MTTQVHMPALDFEFVHAYEMNDTQLKYRCKCKKGYHVHGNGGDPLTNRVEYRASHCPHRLSKNLEIHITDKTIRNLRKH